MDRVTGDSEEPLLEISAERSLVSVQRVTKRFGAKKALDQVSFDVPAGQLCGLLGPNGAGKTTLFRLLMGILKSSFGSLFVDGNDAFEDRVEVKSLVGFLPDEPVFYSYLSGQEILELSASMHGLNPKTTLQRIAPLIERMNLKKDMKNFAEDYSRGMKKKLGLLLALLHQPKLLILDEPTNGLDVESTHLFYELMKEESAKGVTVLFSTHLMDQVSKLCTHCIIINKGQIATSGPLETLRARFDESATLEEIFLQLTSEPAE